MLENTIEILVRFLSEERAARIKAEEMSEERRLDMEAYRSDVRYAHADLDAERRENDSLRVQLRESAAPHELATLRQHEQTLIRIALADRASFEPLKPENKIPVIKAVREKYGLGLKASKVDVVDVWYADISVYKPQEEPA